MANRSEFPQSIDTFIEHQELSASDKPLIQEYQTLMLKSSLTPTESDRLTELASLLRDKLQTAEDFNKLQDAITNLETFFRDEVDGYVNTKQSEMEAHVVSKQNEVTTFVDTKKSEMETYHQGKVDELDSLVSRTEANVILQEVEPTSGLYNGLMWYQPSIDETKVYLGGEFRSVGGGGGALDRYNNRVKTTIQTSEVNIGIELYDKAKDILLVYQNSTYLREGEDYRVNVDSSKIISLSGDWNADTTLDFVVLASIPARDTLNNALIENTIAVAEDTTVLDIGIPEFNSSYDILTVYNDGVKLPEGEYWDLLGGSQIQLTYTAKAGDRFTFGVFKKVRLNIDRLSTDGSLLMSDSITNDKMHQDNKVGSLALLNTTSKTDVVSAINELDSKAKNNNTVIQTLQDSLDTVGSDYNNHKTEFESYKQKDLSQYQMSRSGKDSEGTFAIVEYKDKDTDVLVMKSTLSGGTPPNYITRTEEWFESDGVTVKETVVYTISYDGDGDWVSEVIL